MKLKRELIVWLKIYQSSSESYYWKRFNPDNLARFISVMLLRNTDGGYLELNPMLYS